MNRQSLLGVLERIGRVNRESSLELMGFWEKSNFKRGRPAEMETCFVLSTTVTSMGKFAVTFDTQSVRFASNMYRECNEIFRQLRLLLESLIKSV